MYQVKNSHKPSYTGKKKYCKSFKSFEELGKKIFTNKFLPVAIPPSAKNSIILTASYSEVSSALANLFLSELLQYIGNMFNKSLNVNDAWFGFYSDFKKGTFDYHMGISGLNRLKAEIFWVSPHVARPKILRP